MKNSNTARYRPAPIPEMEGNPLIEALPLAMSREKFLRSTTRKPDAPKEGVTMEKLGRKLQIRMLQACHIPLPQVNKLYNHIYETILTGYAHRNPTDRSVQRLNEQSILNPASVHSAGSPTSVNSTGVIGLTGTGKSTTILACLNSIPQIILHDGEHESSFKGLQLTWVSFSCPETKTAKGFVLSFMFAVDCALGTNYYEQYAKTGSHTVTDYRIAARKIAQLHHIGLIHVDEMQNLKHFDGPDALSFSFIDSLLNELNVPVIWSSTPLIFRALEGRMTTSRRLFSERDFRFEPFKKNSAEWTAFVNEFYFPWLLRYEFEFDAEFVKLAHYACAGLPAIFTRLIRLFYSMANEVRFTEFCPKKHLTEVYGSQFKALHTALEALRKGQSEQFDDMVGQVLASLDLQQDELPTMKPLELESSASTTMSALENLLPEVEFAEGDASTQVEKAPAKHKAKRRAPIKALASVARGQSKTDLLLAELGISSEQLGVQA